jgi:holo-[acyl-carrier protein] synthase
LIDGHGVDVLGLERVREAWENMGQVLARRLLGSQELELFNVLLHDDKAVALNYLAKRFCAKEALLKAMGTGMRPPFEWGDAQLLNDEKGKPYFLLGGMLMVALSGKLIHVSVSDHSDVVIGSVIIEKSQDV